MADPSEAKAEGLSDMMVAQSPAVAKHLVRRFLRKVREERSLTQGEVAQRLSWSLSKVQRIESGDVSVSNADLKALLEHYGEDSGDDLHQLFRLATLARRRDGWWDQAEFRANLTASTIELIQFESEASAFRVFNPSVLPSLLQTDDYAKAVKAQFTHELSEEQLVVRLKARALRRKEFLARSGDSAFQYRLLLDESVLLRQVCRPEVMLAQLEDLLEHMARRVMEVRILPLDSPNLASVSPFIIVELGDAGEQEGVDAVLYLEANLQDQIVKVAKDVQRFVHRFDRMWHSATDANLTELMVRRRADQIRKQLKG